MHIYMFLILLLLLLLVRESLIDAHEKDILHVLIRFESVTLKMKCLKRFSSSMPRIRRDPSVVLVVADPKDPNVKVLRECMKSVDDGTKFYLGNNVDSLKDVAGKADVVVHGTFAGGKASVIEELYPMMKKNLRWVHSLSTGVDGLVPHLKKCDGGNYIVSNAKGAFDSSLAYVCSLLTLEREARECLFLSHTHTHTHIHTQGVVHLLVLLF